MRIFSTVLLTTTFLGLTINDGWCPEPSNLGAPIGSYSGADGAAHVNAPPPPAPIPWEFDPQNPENMTRSDRLRMVGREKAAGRLQTDQELKNFLATGNPAKSWTPPEQKPLVRPKGMSDATWNEYVRTRPKPPDYVRGTPITPLLVPGELPRTMEQNAKAQGGTLTNLPGAVPIPPPPPAKTTTTTMSPDGRSRQVTKLGVHHTPPTTTTTTTAKIIGAAPAKADAIPGAKPPPGFVVRQPPSPPAGATGARIAPPAPKTSAAMDRLGGGPSHGVGAASTGGSKPTTRSSGAAMKDDTHLRVPQVQPRPADTFRPPR